MYTARNEGKIRTMTDKPSNSSTNESVVSPIGPIHSSKQYTQQLSTLLKESQLSVNTQLPSLMRTQW